MAIKIKKRYWMIYKITGDSGVSDRGTYLLQTNSYKEIDDMMEDLAGMCDDRCNAYVVTMSGE